MNITIKKISKKANPQRNFTFLVELANEIGRRWQTELSANQLYEYREFRKALLAKAGVIYRNHEAERIYHSGRFWRGYISEMLEKNQNVQ